MSSFLRSRIFWLVLMLLVAGLALTWWRWDWLRDGSKTASNGDTLRNAGLLLGGVLAFVFAVWRSIVAERQADTAQVQSATAQAQADIAQQQVETAQQGLLNERYQRGAEMLGSPVLSVRLGGIYALERLASSHPQQYYIQISKLLCAFVRLPSKDANFPEQPEYAEDFVLREDSQAAMRVIGTRGNRHLRLAGEEGYSIDLHGADLRGGDLRGLNLSSPSADMIRSMPTHQAFSNPTLRTDLSGARLNGVQFPFTEITGVDFSRNGESPATGLRLSQLMVAQHDAGNPPYLKGVVDDLTGKPMEDGL